MHQNKHSINSITLIKKFLMNFVRCCVASRSFVTRSSYSNSVFFFFRIVHKLSSYFSSFAIINVHRLLVCRKRSMWGKQKCRLQSVSPPCHLTLTLLFCGAPNVQCVEIGSLFSARNSTTSNNVYKKLVRHNPYE